MNYKNPLSVYIIWHPNFLEGQEIADYLYSMLCRNPDKPLVRSMGIPVYYRYKSEKENGSPININFNESDYTAIIPLVTDELVIDDKFSKYINDIYDDCQTHESNRRMYPIALSKNAYNISSKLSAINFIRINSENDESGQFNNKDINEQIKSPILHELCRLLLNMKRESDEVNSIDNSPPVQLFISHSKHDDSKLEAIKFRDYINSKTQLKTFFDANDISYGSNFGEEIKNAASKLALVVFQSDSYAEREWCRIEVLTAKSVGCPIVIVNAIQNGEKRAFPYLGNYPSIRLNKNYQSIIDLTLEQVLFNRYTNLFLRSMTELYNTDTDLILSNVPELFDFISLKKQRKAGNGDSTIVIYPDPPLGTEEIDILEQFDNGFIFITPLMLPSIK